jgi:hypothetical protein
MTTRRWRKPAAHRFFQEFACFLQDASFCVAFNDRTSSIDDNHGGTVCTIFNPDSGTTAGASK